MDLQDKLVLKDEELDDVVLPKEDFDNLREGARWMAVVKVNTTKHFGNQPFFQKMDAAWGFARKWDIRPVVDNLFILQVSCLGDWNRAMLEGPWIFRQMGVMIEPYDGIADPSSVILNRIHAWVQIRGIPPLFRKEGIVRDMAARIGEVLSVDLYVLGASGTSFVRVRVKIDVNKPLTRIVGLHPEGSERLSFQVLYEKLPRYCEVCGVLGNGELECGDGVHGDEAKQYGAWMMAAAEDWYPQTSGMRTRASDRAGAQGVRGGGRGRGGDVGTRKRPPGESSQGAGASGEGKGRGAGTLQITDGIEQADGATPGARRNLALELAGEKGSDKTGLLPSPVKPDPKRARKTEATSTEAGSEEEHRQDQ
jgi:hypothetical protein